MKRKTRVKLMSAYKSTRRQNMTAPVAIAFIQGKAGVDFNTAYWFFNQQNHKRVNK